MRLILLGPPGCGKGTQAALISKKYNIPHISTGDLFRENIKNCTELGKTAKGYIDRGMLVPDEITNRMAKARLSSAEEGFILDGYPRNTSQAEYLAGYMKIDKVINFALPDEEVIMRISGRRTCTKCGATYHVKWKVPKNEGVCDICGGTLVQRSDELPETVRERLRIYHQQTAPLIEYYDSLLSDIDASPAIEAIFSEVVKVLQTSSV